MKRRIFSRILPLAALLCLVLALTGCGDSAGGGDAPDASVTDESAPPAEAPGAGDAAEPEVSLEALLGADYQTYIAQTITMQMGNRMDKTPEVVYFPIQDQKPLTDYVAIDETTAFAVDEEGNVDITLPAGTVTEEANGEQTFTIPKP